MKIQSQSIWFTINATLKAGNVSCQVNAQVITDMSFDEEKTDVEFIDILNIQYHEGDSTINVTDWAAFKKFYLAMGINYNEMLDKEFEKLFNKKDTLAYCKNEFINSLTKIKI